MSLPDLSSENIRKRFHHYIYDHLKKKNLHKSAEIFLKEADVSLYPVENDIPEGFLFEWWSLFDPVYTSRMQKCPNTITEASVEDERILEMKRQIGHFCMQGSGMNQQRVGQLHAGTDFDKLAHSVSTENNIRHSQILPFEQAQHQFAEENRPGNHSVRSLPMEPMPYDVTKATLSSAGLHEPGLSRVYDPLPFEGCPSTVSGAGINQRPGMGYDEGNSLSQTDGQQQLQIPSARPRQLHGSQMQRCKGRKPKSSCPDNSAKMNHQKVMLLKNDPTAKDGLITGRNSSEQMGSSSNQATFGMGRIIPDTNTRRKNRTPSDSRDGNSTMAGCTLTPLKSVSSANMLNVHGSNKIGGMAEISQKMADMDGDDKAENDVESFFSHDDDNDDMLDTPFSTLQPHSTTQNTNSLQVSLEEVGCLHSSKSKVICCHFSSDGKFLASAGHDKKVVLWDMDTFDSKDSADGHSLLITDVRFRPNTTLLATSSFDKTVQIWDAANPSQSSLKLTGHNEQVMSLDFHPRKVDLLCSSDTDNEIRLWDIKEQSCISSNKGGARHVRFQPQIGNLLAAASGNDIRVIDVETDNLFYLKGHVKLVRSICWDTTGKYMASVSEDCVHVWSVDSSRDCIHKLHSNVNKFQSCTFHPGYSFLLVVGGYQTLELWNPTESNKTIEVPAHAGLIAALSDSPCTQMLASASHDQRVKIWK